MRLATSIRSVNVRARTHVVFRARALSGCMEVRMKILLWGAGAHGRVIHDLASACGYYDITFVDDRPTGDSCCGRRVLSPDDDRVGDYKSFIVSQGDNRARARCFY